jgi:hypothetical protein
VKRVLGRLASSPGAALFALVFVGYAYFYQAGGWNQNSRFDLTRAIVERGTLIIDRYEKNTGDESRRDGHYYTDKAPGVSSSSRSARGSRPSPRSGCHRRSR